MKPKRERSPLDRSRLLRLPGQSLSAELDEFMYDHVLTPWLLATFMLVLAGMEWWRYFQDAKPSPEIYTIAAAVMVGYAVYKILSTQKRIRQIRQGRDGERAVAQSLEWLRVSNFFVFHDIPNGDANVDHVLIGPKGVFTIETKTLSKPERGECRIKVVEGVIHANGRELDRNPLVQAKAQAGWMKAFLAEHHFSTPVWPVVLFPGWFVERFDNKAAGAWVLEPKALRSFLDNEPDKLKLDEVKAMASALTSYVQSQIKE